MSAVLKGTRDPDGATGAVGCWLGLLLRRRWRQQLVLPPLLPSMQVHMLKFRCAMVLLLLLPCCMLMPMLQGLQGGSIGLACSVKSSVPAVAAVL